MCGIVGYIGSEPVVPILIEGLKRLEYRGYDSAGITLVEGGRIRTCKTAGKIANLVVYRDDPFAEKSKPVMIFVDGVKYEVSDAE